MKTDIPIVSARNLAEGYVKVRRELSDYKGPLSFEKITSQNPNYIGTMVVFKFWPEKQPYNIVYLQI